jgi:hypothetical protein
MNPEIRTAVWSHSGLSFWRGSRVVARAAFEVGPLGPYAELVGSPVRVEHQQQVERWVKEGALPRLEA